METDLLQVLLQRARMAVLKGDRTAAAHFASQALNLAPNSVDALLLLAGTSDPKKAVSLCNRALDLDPNNSYAKKASQWASQALNAQNAAAWQSEVTQQSPQVPVAKPKKRVSFGSIFVICCTLFLSVFLVLYSLGFVRIAPTKGAQYINKQENGISLMPSQTPSPTATLTATLTPLPTLTQMPSPSPTATEVPTEVPTEIPTETPTEIVPEEPYEEPTLPPAYQAPQGKKTIEINLSQQMLYAWEGDVCVASFVVSTGRAGTETVTGNYQVWIKLPADDMVGPDYNLPGVPWVMYFYRGYGIHGTYWHSNFGTPMSHGCVNMETSEAEWLYNWSFVGIDVYVHY